MNNLLPTLIKMFSHLYKLRTVLLFLQIAYYLALNVSLTLDSESAKTLIFK